MKYLDLFGVDLKNDVLCDLFETYDVEVVYKYDRTHGGLPDEYCAEMPGLGPRFVFDERQVFKTLFMQQIEMSGFNPFDEEDDRLKRFDSKAEACRYASENGEKFTEGAAEFMGEGREWIRFEYGSHSVHYEYVDSRLKVIKIQAREC
jgi:hypothetical protein